MLGRMPNITLPPLGNTAPIPFRGKEWALTPAMVPSLLSPLLNMQYSKITLPKTTMRGRVKWPVL
jgi:hypothetical protein